MYEEYDKKSNSWNIDNFGVEGYKTAFVNNT